MAPRDHKNEKTHRSYSMFPTKREYLAAKLSSRQPDTEQRNVQIFRKKNELILK